MPVRHFDIYLAERQLIQTAPLSVLAGSRLGIEGHYWLRRVLKAYGGTSTGKSTGSSNNAANGNAHASKELEHILASVVALGGAPPIATLQAIVDKEIEQFRSNDIQPFFVFNGLSLPRKERPFSTEDLRPKKRATAWEAYEAGRIDQALSGWGSSGSVNQNDFIHAVLVALSNAGVESMRAPYAAWAQLAYLQNQARGMVNGVVSGSELLMWDVDRVILSLDFDKGTFSWIVNNLASGMLVEGQPLCNGDTQEYRNFIKSPSFLDLRSQSLNLLACNLHRFFQNKNVTSVFWFEAGVEYPMQVQTTPPLGSRWIPDARATGGKDANGANDAKSVTKPGPTLAKTSAWVADERRRQFHTSWADGGEEEHGEVPVDIAFCLTSVDAYARKVKELALVGGERKLPSTRNEFVALVLLRLLELRQFTTDSQTFTALGKAIYRGLNHGAKVSTSIQQTLTRTLGIGGEQVALSVDPANVLKPNQEELFVALELVRMEQLHGRDYNPTYHSTIIDTYLQQTPNAPDPAVVSNLYHQHRRHISLISRVFSLVIFNMRAFGTWPGPYDRNLLVFNSVARAVHRALRILAETVLLSMAMNDGIPKKDSSFSEEFLSLGMDGGVGLPFSTDLHTCMGIIVEVYLGAIVAWESTGATTEAASAKAWAYVAKTYGGCAVDLARDFSKGFMLWVQVVEAVKSLGADKVVGKEVVEEYVKAEEWFKARRK
ncbi:temperature dependent protein affecting M2 dsRNA replication-domain-containing protein [Cladochytrium replicatum]|nr:temperature dependent protein affecting M2 dsRNA replication-domain-containing protein [Cladochytrium replicatum]